MYKVFTADDSEIHSHSIDALCHLICINSAASDRFHRDSLKNRNTILINIVAKILELTLFSVISWPLMPSPRSSSSRRSSTPEMADEQDWGQYVFQLFQQHITLNTKNPKTGPMGRFNLFLQLLPATTT